MSLSNWVTSSLTLRVFIMSISLNMKKTFNESVSDFATCLFGIYWVNHMFFFLVIYSINMVYYINWFLDFQPTLHSHDKFQLVILYNPSFNVAYLLLIFCWRLLHPRPQRIWLCSFPLLWCLSLALVSANSAS